MKSLKLEYPEIERRDDEKICEPKPDKFGHITIEKFDAKRVVFSVGWNSSLLVDASELVDVIKMVSEHGESISDKNDEIRQAMQSAQSVDRQLDGVQTKTVHARRTAGGSKGDK